MDLGSLPTENQDIKHTLVIANKYRGSLSEVLLSLEVDFDPHSTASELVEEFGYDPIGVQSTAPKGSVQWREIAPHIEARPNDERYNPRRI